jgi:hypothetical protein
VRAQLAPVRAVLVQLEARDARGHEVGALLGRQAQHVEAVACLVDEHVLVGLGALAVRLDPAA